MTFLVLDSSTERASCALFVDEELISRRDIPFGLSNTSFLLPSVRDMFEETGCLLKNLQFIACGIGPGSFTGIRVSCALAKGMQAVLHVPIIGVSTLHGFIPTERFEGRFMSAIDARMGGVFVQEGIMKHGRITWYGTERLIAIDVFVERLKEVDLLITPHVAPLFNRMSLGDLPIIERGIDAQYMGQQALQRFRQGDIGELVPLYLRATQAEIDAKPR